MAFTTDEERNPQRERAVIRGRDEIRDHIAALVERAGREVAVFAPQYDAFYFNTARLADALARFAARHRQNRARVLVEDTEQLLRDNERVVELIRRFSDAIELRQLDEQDVGLRELWVCTDHNGYLQQLDVAKPECVVDFNNRQEAAALVRRFDEVWNRGVPLPGVRTLGL